MSLPGFVGSNPFEPGDEGHFYRGSAEEKTGREGPPRRRLPTATANSAAKQQQQGTAGVESTTRAGAGVAESRTPKALAGERSKPSVLRTVNGERRPEVALEEADGRAAQIQGLETMDAVLGEGHGIRDGVVEPVEGGGAEEDKGIEEGEAEGFVVEARDDKVRSRNRVPCCLG